MDLREWFPIIALVLVIVVVMAALRRNARTQQRAPRQSSGARALPIGNLEARVLSQAQGDRARVERLVKQKQARLPQASRQELLQAVYEDHVSDSRR